MDRPTFARKIDLYLASISQDPSILHKLTAMQINVKIVIDELASPISICAGPDCLRERQTVFRWCWGDLDDFTPDATLSAHQKTAEQLLSGKLNFIMAMARGRLRIKGRKKAAMNMFKIIETAKSHYQKISAMQDESSRRTG